MPLKAKLYSELLQNALPASTDEVTSVVMTSQLLPCATAPVLLTSLTFTAEQSVKNVASEVRMRSDSVTTSLTGYRDELLAIASYFMKMRYSM